jgi:hypothetical protein
MARKTKAKLDKDGLGSLGLEKLVEILLDEAQANKALKARLLAALAGTSGADEIARLIDKRLDTLERSKSSVAPSKARELAVELLGIARNIASELGSADALAAFVRLLRLLSIYDAVRQRIYEDSVKLNKSERDAEALTVEFAAGLNEQLQDKAVAHLEAARKKDDLGERFAMFSTILLSFQPAAADAWKSLIEPDLQSVAKSRFGPDKASYAIDMLQALAEHRGDLDTYIALERAKPEFRRDSMTTARKLYEAQRYQDALQWVRMEAKGMRTVHIGGMTVGVGPEYQSGARKLLEAEILDGLKQRSSAQEIRWQEFLKTFDAAILRRYIAKLDDFAEFDELDKAFDAVRRSPDIYPALDFLVEWPKLDMASEHVSRHAKKWDGRQYAYLVPAADALVGNHPVAATTLYRALLNAILIPSNSAAYPHAARYYAALVAMSQLLPASLPFESHADYVEGIKAKHGRKYSFWELVHAQLR